MLSVLLLFLIYVGVCLSIYQVYDIYCNPNVLEDEENTPSNENAALNDLSLQAKEYAETGRLSGFIQTVKKAFGEDIDYRVALAAFTGGNGLTEAEALLRRKNNVVLNGRIKIRHLSLFTTHPPTIDIRGPLLSTIVINMLIVLFIAGLSVLTTAYEFSIDSLSWTNNELILMLMIYFLIAFTHALSKFDRYMNDIYKIGKLNRHLS